MIRIFNEEYGVRKKSEINSIHDLKFTDLVGKKVDKKKKVKITNIYSENNGEFLYCFLRYSEHKSFDHHNPFFHLVSCF